MAQQAGPQKENGYQAVFLSSLTPKTDLKDKAYFIQENGTKLSLADVQDMIRNGTLLSHKIRSSHLNLGNEGKGSWLVIPVVNKSSRQNWDLNLGSFKDGRISTLKEIMLYNMNEHKFIVNTQTPDTKSQNIPSSLTLNIPQNTTTFFILFLKPNLAIPTYVFPSLEPPNQTGFLDLLGRWLNMALAFGAFIFFIKSAKDNKSVSHIFMGILWLSVSLVLLSGAGYLYVSWEVEYVHALIWVLAPLMLMLSLLFTKELRYEIPTQFLIGLSSVFLTSGLAGIIILKSLPQTALYLIYTPAFFAFAIIAFICWGPSIREKRHAYLSIAYTCFFLFGFFPWALLLNIEFISLNQFTLLVPQVLLFSAISGSIAGANPTSQPINEQAALSDDVFSENKISTKEGQLISEAKEHSEHHRLMQVIEQERKLMSDLQVKTAQQNEDMRRAKEAADEANRAKSAFLAVVSHEIRTPMTGIMGMLRLLQDTQLTKEQKEYSSTIKDSGDAMLALLNDILDFEKIESGKMDLENINFDLKRLVRGVFTLMRGHAEAKNVELVLEIDSSTPNWVYGDPTRLRQVLLNLINNAIKFTSKGAVYLRIRDLTSGQEDPGTKIHQIYFAVQDSGIGIGAESQRKLFMPFAQADSSVSRKYGGTGLGLAICKRLIEAMGGAISINSKEGEGSTFFFTIGMTEGHETIEDGSESSPYQTESAPMQKANFKSPIHVLVVDDNGINQKVVAGFVDKLGAQSMTASSGADALDMLARYQFDLILMDIQLPDMNGLEVTKIIRDLPIHGKANVPIVALSGNSSDEDIKACIDAGMNDFAAKPITFEKTLELLTNVDKQIYFSRSSPPQIAGYTTGNTTYTQPDYPAISDTLPSGRDNDEVVFSNTDTSFLNSEDFELGEDEEDSFALAVRKFEEMEKLNEGSLYTPPLQPPREGGGGGALADYGLDQEILGSLKSGLSIEQIQEILVSFYEKADELIADIGNAYLSSDSVGLNARAHELKGMAGNFGFSELSRMCAIIEKAAKDNQLDITKEPIEHLGESYAMARGHLNIWLSEK